MDKVIVKGLNSAYKEPLSSILFDTFNIQWQFNSTFEISFTAYDDGRIGYRSLDIESSLFYLGEEYIIKQFEPDFSQGLSTVQVTATHVYNEVVRIWQSNVRTGELTYQPKDVLAFYLDGNKLGFTYEVKGTFDNQQISDLGNSSGSDMLSKITETWSNAVIYPVGRKIIVYSSDEFAKDNGGRVDYLNNASEISIQYDSTDIVNSMKVIGKEIETDSDSDSDIVSYYFPPHIVKNQTSIDKWGEHQGDDLEDDRFTNSDSMDAYAMTQMVEPTLEIDITMNSNDKPTAGEVRRLEVRGNMYATKVQVMGYTYYPFSATQPTSLTLNSKSKTILDYQNSNNKLLNAAITNLKNSIKNETNNNGNQGNYTWTGEEVDEFGSNVKSS